MAEKNRNMNSFMKSLFFGEIREEMIFPYPRIANESGENVAMILDSIQKFSNSKFESAKWDEAGSMPREIVTELADLGLLGLAVPEEYGGLGLSQQAYARVMQEVSGLDGSVATTLGAHQSIGYKALLLFGTEEQKSKYLPRLASGELIACYCLTEPGSGSDAASIKTRAVRSADGKSYAITGNKLWITNGGIASFMTIFAKTEVDGHDKVSCFILETPAKGVSVGPPEHKLGIRASWTNAIFFENVSVPAENVIGGVGMGFKVAMGVLNHGRMGLAAGSVGGSKKALEAAILHANERVQFKKKIGEFGMIKEKIARMTTNIFVAESMVYMTTALIDRAHTDPSLDYSIESAIAKIYASETLWDCCDENLQIWAGNGYMKEYPYERWLRDARINRIFEGTNEILRAFIALSGMQAPGQELAGLAEAIKFPLKGLGPVTDYVGRRIKRNVMGENISQSHPALKKMAGVLEEYAGEFANQIEILLRRHGKEIHLQQLAQKRIADIAIELYGMVCVLSRMSAILTENGVEKSQFELAIAEAAFQRANSKIRNNFRQIDRNDDDSIKFIAERAYELGKYPFEPMKG